MMHFLGSIMSSFYPTPSINPAPQPGWMIRIVDVLTRDE